ncbi:MAG: carbamoyl-phosphate synthase small subunit [Bdellovibrionales bacterium CG10_big_fil_rev_8_21_14_0_10_45_34]|nr:MAG: carbamoyl-phosphate synthase small subunit [Bdellovibrionales bacterium CG10_big_fil_rev_8_21_14_0_10_45_34]
MDRIRRKGFVVLETREVFEGYWVGGAASVGELVFNTSHSGYEEIATDPSYLNQIVVMTAPMQGNYGVVPETRQSENFHIKGFVCLDIQNSDRDRSWSEILTNQSIAVIDGLDTRSLVLYLRQRGTTWGAALDAETQEEALTLGLELISKNKVVASDWTRQVCVKEELRVAGLKPAGPTIALLDFGCKSNILNLVKQHSREVSVFPSWTDADQLVHFDGVVLSNGPGDPADVKKGVETVKSLLGRLPMFGICMGHQVLGLALGAKTFKLKFGHRGANHPIEDEILGQVYVSSQNHGYAIVEETLPKDVIVTHRNLNDKTVAGIACKALNCMSVQFHPESSPGPNEARALFNYFFERMLK